VGFPPLRGGSLEGADAVLVLVPVSIDDYVKRYRNPFTKAAVDRLDFGRLGMIRDDTARIHLQSTKSEHGNGILRGSRFGGQPLLPRGSHWPEGPEGPLTFVGWLNFEQLAATHKGDVPLPGQGALAFFYDVKNQPWGANQEDSRSWQFVYVPDLASAQAVEREEAGRLPLRLLQPEFVVEEEDVRFGRTEHQVWGPPRWLQDDPRLELQLRQNELDWSDLSALRAAEERGVDVIGIAKDARQWRLLWQIDTENDLFAWGDCGKLIVLIRQADLEELRFDRAWCIMQSM
jgi:uncharacterized protein YwqG